MSDDVPIIIAHEPAPRHVVFASAASEVQMQQYATAGWAVTIAPGFRSLKPIEPARLPPQGTGNADVVSLEAALMDNVPDAAIVKVNCAFADAVAERGMAAANELAKRGYFVLGAHWRDDNTYRIRSLERIDLLAALEPVVWHRINIIACRDQARAEVIVRFARVYAAQERRAAEMKVGEAIRTDYIAKLEDAVQTLQARIAAK